MKNLELILSTMKNLEELLFPISDKLLRPRHKRGYWCRDRNPGMGQDTGPRAEPVQLPEFSKMPKESAGEKTARSTHNPGSSDLLHRE